LHLQIKKIKNSFQHFDGLYNWKGLLLDFGTAVCSSTPFIETNVNDNEIDSLNRRVTVLKKLKACKGAAIALINIQLCVISLHQMMTKVSPLF
jgi:hypothetical protein